MSANNNRSSSQNPCQCDADLCHIQTRLHHVSSHDTCKRPRPYNSSRDVSSQFTICSLVRNSRKLNVYYFSSPAVRVNANSLMKTHSLRCHFFFTAVKYQPLTNPFPTNFRRMRTIETASDTLNFSPYLHYIPYGSVGAGRSTVFNRLTFSLRKISKRTESGIHLFS